MALHQIDIRALAEMTGAERAFVSLYLSGPDGLEKLNDREARIRGLLADLPAEREHFDQSLRMIREALDEHGVEGPMALFASWALDFVVGYALDVAPPDLLWVDSSPYVRPLAELQDEYETFVVVSADADAARVHVVTALVPEQVDRVRGAVKNHVKKGGWSQKRYQRRRENQMLQYAKDVAAAVATVVDEQGITRIVLLGAQQATAGIEAALPDRLKAFVVGPRPAELGGDDDALFETAAGLSAEREREDETSLWERIRGEALSHGLAAFGPGEVLAAARDGRVDTMIVTRDATIPGIRCRDCERLSFAKPQQCPACKSNSVFDVDLVNELVELLAMTGGRVDFVDPLDGLTERGDVAALLRYPDPSR